MSVRPAARNAAATSPGRTSVVELTIPASLVSNVPGHGGGRPCFAREPWGGGAASAHPERSRAPRPQARGTAAGAGGQWRARLFAAEHVDAVPIEDLDVAVVRVEHLDERG